jgi:hypothetical protein
LSRLATSFVLGYHGCDRAVGLKAVLGQTGLIQSDRDYDWLGPGVYFWESDPVRAMEWANWKASRGEYAEPFVIGAVIDLRNCLDLASRENLEIVRLAYLSFIALQNEAGNPIPKNKGVSGQPDEDIKLRYLDCAVMRHLHEITYKKEPYDTVRGLFTEGDPLYPDGGFKSHTHVQIAVRNLKCILGLFLPNHLINLSGVK